MRYDYSQESANELLEASDKEIVSLREQLTEARKLLATRVEASRLDDAMDQLAAMTKERDLWIERCNLLGGDE